MLKLVLIALEILKQIQQSRGTVGLPDSSRLTVHSLYPAAAAITAGILLVGRPRTAIFLSLFCSTKRASCCLPVGNKVKGFIHPGSRSSFRPRGERSRRSPGIEPYGADGCLKQENREIAKEKFSSENFQAQRRTFKFQESVARGRVVTAEKS